MSEAQKNTLEIAIELINRMDEKGVKVLETYLLGMCAMADIADEKAKDTKKAEA